MFQIIYWILMLIHVTSCDLVFTPVDISVCVNEETSFEASLSNEISNLELWLESEAEDIAKTLKSNVNISNAEVQTIIVKGFKPGHVTIIGNFTGHEEVNRDWAFVRVTVGRLCAWIVLSDVVGWIYFAAWSVSFYPQIYENWKRKSVVGLNFDFIYLNLLGFFLYSVFNIGLYAFEPIKKSYHATHPHTVNPVQINDIVFSVHAFFAVVVTLVQCYFYERENQKVSKYAKGLFAVYGVFLGICLVLSSTDVMKLLDFLYMCSYVKLSVTLIKYIPQAYMNYKRKSTIGWSIGNIFLDFTGGLLSMLQMIINSYNYNDWKSIFGDPTKFGLGLFSVLFDIFFILQHYVFYRHSNTLNEL